MVIRNSISAITFSLACFYGCNAVAQNISALSSVVSDDAVTMRQFKNLLPESDRRFTPFVQIDYGPLLYRLSTAQGVVFESTTKPLIVRLSPDDGLSDKILGGIPVKNDEFPWQVALLNSTYGTLFCGGSHIGNGWVVTAAHCIFDQFGQSLKKRDILVLSGTVSLTSGGNRLSLEQDPIFHEQYDPISKNNDIALLKFSTRGSLPSISIPLSSTEAPLISEGSQLVVSGWGRTTEGGNISTELLKVGVPIIPSQQCTTVYSSVKSNQQICAGITGLDSCQGDSGGPLTGLDSNGRVLIGVVSFGRGCGRSGYPGVYTRVIAYKDWIKQKTDI